MVVPSSIKWYKEVQKRLKKNNPARHEPWFDRLLRPINDSTIVRDPKYIGGAAIVELEPFGARLEVLMTMGSCLNLHRQFASLAFSDDESFLRFAGLHGFLWDGLSKSGRHVHSNNPELDPNVETKSEPLIFWKWHAERIRFLIQLTDILKQCRPDTANGFAESVLEVGQTFGEPVDRHEVLTLAEEVTNHPLFPGLLGHFYLRQEITNLESILRLESYFPWLPEFDQGFIFANTYWDSKARSTRGYFSRPNIEDDPTTPAWFMDQAVKYVGDAISRSVQQYSLFKLCPYTGDVEIQPQGVLGLCYLLLLREFSGHRLRSERLCTGCGKAFQPDRKDQMYCQDERGFSSSKCRQMAHRRRKS